MIVADPDPSVRLVGAVRGRLEELEGIRSAVAGFRPAAVGLGLSPAEAEALSEHFLDDAAEPVVPMGPTEVAEARALARYGEVGVPNPAFVDLLRWGRTAGIPVEGLDPDEEVQGELFVAHIGYFELVRRTVRERRAGRRPPAAEDADGFALAWDRTTHPGRGSERYAMARDRALVDALSALRGRVGRTAVVVDRERFERIRSLVAPEGARVSPTRGAGPR